MLQRLRYRAFCFSELAFVQALSSWCRCADKFMRKLCAESKFAHRNGTHKFLLRLCKRSSNRQRQSLLCCSRSFFQLAKLLIETILTKAQGTTQILPSLKYVGHSSVQGSYLEKEVYVLALHLLFGERSFYQTALAAPRSAFCKHKCQWSRPQKSIRSIKEVQETWYRATAL